MTLGHKIRPFIPNLRRYGHALTGTKENGDILVKATLKAILSDRTLLDCRANLRIGLFRIFHLVFREASDELQKYDSLKMSPKNAVVEKISTYVPLTRHLVLLYLLEEMCISEIALILNVRERVADELLGQALDDLACNEPVLIKNARHGAVKSTGSRPVLSLRTLGIEPFGTGQTVAENRKRRKEKTQERDVSRR